MDQKLPVISQSKRKTRYQKDMAVGKRTLSEYIYKTDPQRYIFAEEGEDFWYCHVNFDQLEIRQTPPDLYTMAAETGYNLVGIGVAMNVYIQMLSSGKQTYLLPHYYQTFRCPEQYKHTQQIIFDNFSSLLGLITYDMYMAGYYNSCAGGGLGVYIHLLSEQLSQVLQAQQLAIEVLSKLYRSKEFSFIEYGLRDPEYGNMMFNNITWSNLNVNFSEDPDQYFGINWNIYNPWRFESQIKNYVSIYDETISDSIIYQLNGISASDTVNDSLAVSQVEGTSPYVQTVNFSFNISNNRGCNNMILTYKNKPKNNPNGNMVTKKYLVKGDDAMEQFFRAGSWFIVQPLITNYMYVTWLRETGKDAELLSHKFQPNSITVDHQNEFTQYYKDTLKYGSALGSGVAGQLYNKLTSITTGI